MRTYFNGLLGRKKNLVIENVLEKKNQKVSYRQNQKNQKDTRYKILFCKIQQIPLDTQKSIVDTSIGDTLPILPNPGKKTAVSN